MAKRGRKRYNFSFEEARILVREEGLTSKAQYAKWYALNVPSRIPKRPDRAYEKEWVSWNDFLGSNNPFPCVRRKFRPYKDARAFAQKLGFTSKTQWIAFAKTDKKPIDIPSRPDVYYQKSREWFTWKEFLGSDITSRIKATTESNVIFFMVKYPNSPSNVFKFGLVDGGIPAIKDAHKKHGFKVVRLFNVTKEFNWHSIVTKHGSVYLMNGMENEYMINDIGSLLYDISNTESVSPVQANQLV